MFKKLGRGLGSALSKVRDNISTAVGAAPKEPPPHGDGTKIPAKVPPQLFESFYCECLQRWPRALPRMKLLRSYSKQLEKWEGSGTVYVLDFKSRQKLGPGTVEPYTGTWDILTIPPYANFQGFVTINELRCEHWLVSTKSRGSVVTHKHYYVYVMPTMEAVLHKFVSDTRGAIRSYIDKEFYNVQVMDADFDMFGVPPRPLGPAAPTFVKSAATLSLSSSKSSSKSSSSSSKSATRSPSISSSSNSHLPPMMNSSSLSLGKPVESGQMRSSGPPMMMMEVHPPPPPPPPLSQYEEPDDLMSLDGMEMRVQSTSVTEDPHFAKDRQQQQQQQRQQRQQTTTARGERRRRRISGGGAAAAASAAAPAVVVVDQHPRPIVSSSLPSSSSLSPLMGPAIGMGLGPPPPRRQQPRMLGVMQTQPGMMPQGPTVPRFAQGGVMSQPPTEMPMMPMLAGGVGGVGDRGGGGGGIGMESSHGMTNRHHMQKMHAGEMPGMSPISTMSRGRHQVCSEASFAGFLQSLENESLMAKGREKAMKNFAKRNYVCCEQLVRIWKALSVKEEKILAAKIFKKKVVDREQIHMSISHLDFQQQVLEIYS